VKDRTKNLFSKLAELTCKKCETCPVIEKYRCCDNLFCELNEQSLKANNKTYDKPNVGGIPYMSDKGCVISPEDRPYCTGYVCVPHFEDKEFRKKYDDTIRRIGQDSSAPPMPTILRNLFNKRS
jgi:hypothetical protein